MSFLTEIEKNLKIYMETEKSPDSKNTPEQKEYAIGVTISYYRAVGGNTSQGWGDGSTGKSTCFASMKT